MIIEHSTRFIGLEEHRLIKITVILSLFLWVSFYYMWRLEADFAFYVSMLGATILDLTAFLFFYFMIIVSGATVWIVTFNWENTLNSELVSDDQYNTIFTQYSDHAEVDSFISVWNLALGDFKLENYANKTTIMPFLAFLLISLITNIVFLNMMIAVMADTFNKMTEKRERNGLRERTMLYADFMQLLRIDSYLDKNRFLYIVTPKN